MCGYKILVVKSNSDGLIDLDSLKELVSDQTAAIMLTNPNTLGLFEENILEVSDIIHENGGMLYYDGANFNPLLGVVKPHLMGFDVMHLNIHKTFSTPHGCGGPGAGVVGVCEKLVEYLPVPIVSKNDNSFYFDYDCKHTIGRLRSFYGNFSVLLRAYAYILRLGRDGLRRVAHNSVLNANYIKESLKDYYEVPYPKTCMHEVVFSCSKQKERGVSALDISKRLIDYGIHPPTMYFPLIVKEALMVEPTETESKDTIDNFIKILKKIDKETVDNPQIVKDSPQAALVMRVDEVRAARNLEVKWKKDGA
jgi:glycine cleavage system P protein (glycine dehydrogenase) subunit 2